MAHDLDTLGLRILNAARLAAAMHLSDVATATVQPGQQVVIGLTGPRRRTMARSRAFGDARADLAKEGALPAAEGEAA